MAIAWIAVRPLLAIGLLVVAAALGAAAFWTHQNKRSGQAGGKAAENPEEVTAAAAPPVLAVPAVSPGQQVQVTVPAGMAPGQTLSIDPDGPVTEPSTINPLANGRLNSALCCCAQEGPQPT